MIILSATTGGVCIVFHAVVGAPVGIASAGFTIVFSLTTGIIKKLLSITKKAKRKSTLRFLCWLKINSIALKL